MTGESFSEQHSSVFRSLTENSRYEGGWYRDGIDHPDFRKIDVLNPTESEAALQAEAAETAAETNAESGE